MYAPEKSSHFFELLSPKFQWVFVAQRLRRAVVIVLVKPSTYESIGFREVAKNCATRCILLSRCERTVQSGRSAHAYIACPKRAGFDAEFATLLPGKRKKATYLGLAWGDGFSQKGITPINTE